ncbi:MAG: histidinol dehydrogenase [Deltaproteobacteria bacterium]|nr:MAG: histidinol dehydrogenase [Deltaproteobacteria bacterium]
MKTLTYPSSEAEARIAEIVNRTLSYSETLERAVVEIIQAVRSEGDEAVLHYTRQFDAPEIRLEQIRVSDKEMERAVGEVDPHFTSLLKRAKHNIFRFHESQRRHSWFQTSEDGSIVGQMIRPVSSAGLYIPGGRAGETPLISSLLMNAIPAMVAGVSRLQMVSPPRKDGTINPYLLVAAQNLEISGVFKVGSAWAIAALAFGTETIPAVDIIVGPGNIYVTLAKKLLVGQVGVDMIAGPSEILVIADASADPRHVAADLLSQAEHDALSSALLLTTDAQLGEATCSELEAQLAKLPRRETAAESLENFGGVIVVPDLDTAVHLANRIAPEHLELLVDHPFTLLAKIRNAGAVFLGHHSPEPVGDYFAGPNHVLPTAGTARFSSGLSVDHFIKKTSLISYSEEALQRDSADIIRLAELEGLEAHARSVKVRLEAD